jgi:hypothetical protein
MLDVYRMWDSDDGLVDGLLVGFSKVGRYYE